MELRRYADIVRRRWWLLLLGPVVAGLVAYFVSESQTDIYQAETTVLVNQTQTSGTIQLNDILASERLTNTYAELAEQRPILRAVIDELDLAFSENELKSKIDIDPVTDTQLLKVKVKGDDPVLAATIANALGQEFIETNESVSGRSGTISVVEPAVVPTSRVEPRVMLNTVLAVVIGLLIAGGIVLALEHLDDTVKSSADVANVGLSPLAVVRPLKNGRGRKEKDETPLVAAESLSSPAAEAYRILRTNIQFVTRKKRAKVLLVTSGNPLEGKSTTALNLAVVMAQAGRRTVLIDTDLRRPSLHRYFGIANDQGVTTLLLDGSRDIGQALRETWVQNLAVIPSGPLPPDPSEMLSSSQMTQLLKRASELADVVILDSPSLHTVADASILAGHADATLLVIEAAKTRTDAVRRSVETLSRAKARTLGAVLNKVKVAEGDGQYPSSGSKGLSLVIEAAKTRTQAVWRSVERLSQRHYPQRAGTVPTVVREGRFEQGRMAELTTSPHVLVGHRTPAAVRYSFYRQRGKRLLDLALAVPMFLSLLPIMAVIGLALLVTSGWQVLYRSERLGRDGKRFQMWKFRTMVRGADQLMRRWKQTDPHLAEEYSKNFKLEDDPRVTRLGQLLRKSSLDELPQLWNVLRGEMSLVGPRPYLPTLAPSPAFEQIILSVSPGMTGPWQAQGRNKLPPLTRMQLDVEYAADVRLTKDIKYLLSIGKIIISFNGV